MSALPIQYAQTEALAGRTARDLYHALYASEPADAVCEASRVYLQGCLEQGGSLPCDLPADSTGLEEWMAMRHEDVGRQYLDYLAQRKAGAPRRYFANRSHVLYFLQGVSPTKFVDGAWLHGLLPQWWDDRYRALIRIYLEELGEGRAADNHVAMYRRLLAVNGCEHIMPLSDGHYVQGAIQLSLARNAAHFMPEVVGFNLGYEQLPLHLLITTHELKELGVDSYYFQVHATVDNAATGHARKALESVRGLCPTGMDERRYYERVKRGYLLNDLGESTVSVIESFDLDEEMTRVLAEKGVHGRHMHSDYCKVGGRTVNEWLSSAQAIPLFLHELERYGWIRRNTDPAQSRFWRLLDEGADMFGVFSAYERQVIYDWIAGTWQPGRENRRTAAEAVCGDRNLSRRLVGLGAGSCDASLSTQLEGDFGMEMRDFESEVMQAHSKRELMPRLAAMMDPSLHHTPVGLAATRMFGRLLDTA
ncbi:iron-containing redox enzyme family protein [Pusillimonas sp.]|uniref:iron-containing redox enzyme family protein n=1 Tax=Pusillimonas sp. TaxID=3040095 RepID=UPI0037CCB4A7